MNNVSIKTFDKLIQLGIVPSNGNYLITETMLEAFVSTYSNIGTGGKKCSVRFARKLAGLSCLKHKLSLGYTYKDIREGIVYFIENPAWPNLIKVGLTVDLDKRLASYQTYSPFRDFKVKHYEFVLDRRIAEKRLLSSDLVEPQEGEWVKVKDALELIELVKVI